MAEYVSLTEEEIINYINSGTTPQSQTQTYAISELLKPGVYVDYDTESLGYSGGWQVLSNDGTKVELISLDICKNVTLSGETGYKEAVKKLNAEAQSYLNTSYAISARSVGEGSLSTDTVMETLQHNPSDYLQLTDVEYYKDFSNMNYSGTLAASSGSEYWIASRRATNMVEGCAFDVRTIKWEILSLSDLFFTYASGRSNTYSDVYGLRCVVTLKDDLKITGGSGLEGDGYILDVN